MVLAEGKSVAQVARELDPTESEPRTWVERNFRATRPNQLWLVDLAYLATWLGCVYVVFVVDTFTRRIIGWRLT